jgi:hypothetical protein
MGTGPDKVYFGGSGEEGYAVGRSVSADSRGFTGTSRGVSLCDPVYSEYGLARDEGIAGANPTGTAFPRQDTKRRNHEGSCVGVLEPPVTPGDVVCRHVGVRVCVVTVLRFDGGWGAWRVGWFVHPLVFGPDLYFFCIGADHWFWCLVL